MVNPHQPVRRRALEALEGWLQVRPAIQREPCIACDAEQTVTEGGAAHADGATMRRRLTLPDDDVDALERNARRSLLRRSDG
jgi:hypothetical protein